MNEVTGAQREMRQWEFSYLKEHSLKNLISALKGTLMFEGQEVTPEFLEAVRNEIKRREVLQSK